MPADSPRPVVWVLHMWDPPNGPAPGLIQEPGPWRRGGCLLGVFATRAAALTELLAWSDLEEVAAMTWTTPGADPEYQELRGTLGQHWFTLGPENVWAGPTAPLPFLRRATARRLADGDAPG